jgi:hypothetical protein
MRPPNLLLVFADQMRGPWIAAACRRPAVAGHAPRRAFHPSASLAAQ